MTCPECGLAIERRGLHPWCRVVRAERRKTDRFAALMDKVKPAVLMAVNDCPMTISPKGVLGRIPDATRKNGFSLRGVKIVMDVLSNYGEIHRIGNRFFSSNLLRDSRNAFR